MESASRSGFDLTPRHHAGSELGFAERHGAAFKAFSLDNRRFEVVVAAEASPWVQLADRAGVDTRTVDATLAGSDTGQATASRLGAIRARKSRLRARLMEAAQLA